MSIARLYQASPLTVNTSIRLDERAFHHAARVLRAKVGEQVILFNGEGGEYKAVIKNIDKKGMDVDILAFSEREAESPVAIHLAQGIARGEKMDFIVQKAVELGVSSIVPLFTERCNIKLADERAGKRLAHWRSICIGACEQSGRNRLPKIVEPISLNDWLPSAKADYSFVLSPVAQEKIPALTLKPQAAILLLIGPEGGLSETEINRAKQTGFMPLNLGPRILRTETASIAAITALQCRFGDLA